ncbi:accessory gene regulator B [Paenibacillus sp. 1_12]|uniref:accessory gene regulator B family protein n=1 Tax=Paenibacillus sp. 1_12 TaxID=1566278 RepID=UPI0008DEDDA7|nr:accessory gene regulator B family protein [Paenibacillus sp. 1_12]SFL24888.1 accessory gene regulator B [Paenibacillus sp. 1_12]
MSIIDQSAEFLAKSIRKNYSEAGSETALKYALSLIINTFISITISLLFCLITGHFIQCVLGIAAFILIRSITGGMHASSSMSCCIISILIFNTIAFVTFDYSLYSAVLDAAAIVVFLITTPNNIQNMSSLDPKYYPILKLIAVLMVSSNFIIQSTMLTAAFCIQAFLTTSPAYRLRDFIERRC